MTPGPESAIRPALVNAPQTDPSDADQQAAGWDLIIEPAASIFRLPFGEIWRYRDLLYLFMRRDIVATYKQTLLGPVWLLLQPLLLAITFVVIFSGVANLSTDGAPPVLFYLVGVVFWQYFSDCLTRTADTFQAHGALFNKVYFPRIIVPLSIVGACLFRLAIQCGLLLMVWGYFLFQGELQPGPSLALLPCFVCLLSLLGLGFGLIVSAATSKYRDLKYLVPLLTQILLYATPVIYPLSIANGKLKTWLGLNPLAPVFEALRHAMLGVGEMGLWGLAYSASITILLVLAGLLMFNYVEQTVVDTV